RPRSSVTTILTNFVGRSLVSAITQTPASGPFALVTTPAISSGSIAIEPLGVCPASVARLAANSAPPSAPMVFIFLPLFLLFHSLLLRRWRNQAFQAHVGDDVAVVLEVVVRVELEDRQLRHITRHELHHRCAGGIGHSGVDLVAERERIGQR